MIITICRIQHIYDHINNNAIHDQLYNVNHLSRITSHYVISSIDSISIAIMTTIKIMMPILDTKQSITISIVNA